MTWCYLTDDPGHFRDFNRILAGSDREALQTAWRQLGDERAYPGFELWQEDRLIHRQDGNELPKRLAEEIASFDCCSD